MSTDPLNTPRKRRLVPAAAPPPVLISVGGEWIKVQTEKVGRSSLFLISDVFIPPRAVFELRIDMEPAPLRVRATASFVEKTAQGYGIGVDFSSLSTEDEQRWNQFANKITALAAATVKSGARLRPTASSQRSSMVVVAPALPESTITAMQKVGVDVVSVPTFDEALARAKSGGVKMVVADLPPGKLQGPEIAGRLRKASPALLSVLLTERAEVAEFDATVKAGASMVVAKPCGQKLLITRVLALFNEKPAADPSAPAKK